MKEITEQQIRDRANEIGSRPIYPTAGIPWNGGKILKAAPSEGMTYKMWLIGQAISSASVFSTLDVFGIVDTILEQLAKAELEAEQEVSNG
jgi:hypothetical protein